MRRFLSRLLGSLTDGLVAYGMLYAGVSVPGQDARRRAAGARTRPAVLDEPPARHPERLCPEVPLTPAERALLREFGTR